MPCFTVKVRGLSGGNNLLVSLSVGKTGSGAKDKALNKTQQFFGQVECKYPVFSEWIIQKTVWHA